MKIKLAICSLALLLIPLSLKAATITPSVMEKSIQKGENATVMFSVINSSANEQTYYLDTMSFRSKNETGTPDFYKANNGLEQWIQFPLSKIVVPARNKTEVPFNVVIPKDEKPGSYFAAITVSSAPADIVATNGATIEAKTAMLFIVTVPGETSIKAGILDFISKNTNKFRTDLSDEYTWRIQNQGNVHFTPTGGIALKDFIGRNLSSVEINQQSGRVLPNSTRTFSEKVGAESKNIFQKLWNQIKNPAIGKITATLTVVPAENSQTVSSSLTFIYIPVESLVLIIVVIVGLIILIKKKNN